MEDDGKEEIKELFDAYFEEINLDVQFVESEKNIFTYQYPNIAFDGVNWAKKWHQDYETQLTKILKDQLAKYFSMDVNMPTSIEEAGLIKLAYYDWQNFKQRPSDFSKTRINISNTSVNPKLFEEDNVAPNLSLGRIVTNSFHNHYNEAYPIVNLEQSIRFVFGPSSKARLKDCLSSHIHGIVHDLESPIYIGSQTLVLVPEENIPVDETSLVQLKRTAESQLINMANEPNYRFYSIHDLTILPEVIKEYRLEDYEDFERMYFKENSYNIGHPLDYVDSCFNKSILDKKVHFKVNSIHFLNNTDSLVLNSLASFLLSNEELVLLIKGYQDDNEYTKIDKKKFKMLVNSYEHYPPVKSSKRAQLSIYRAVVVFDYLAKKGVHPQRISCISSKVKVKDESSMIVDWVLK